MTALHHNDAALCSRMPSNRGLFYGGRWHSAHGGERETFSPGTGTSLGMIAEADIADVNAAVAAAQAGFEAWRHVPPLERGRALRRIATVLRENAEELGFIDAANCGNPVSAMVVDARVGADYIDYFAGLVSEIKGAVTPMGPGVVNMTVHEPLGVCVRILAYNHPLMFAAMKLGAPIAAGNSVIIKPPPQAPLSALRLFELIGDILPPGVLNLVTGGHIAGEALVDHKHTPSVSLIGSVESGRAVARAAADRLKHVGLELGGKNAMIVYPDADLEKAITGAVAGMNFTWCGQSCGSTSRLFLHESIHDEVVAGILTQTSKLKPDLPTLPETNMGAVISLSQQQKILSYIDTAKSIDHATLIYGGAVPTDAHLTGGYYVEPTIFTDVQQHMRIAREEVFGPVLSVLRWSDEGAMFADVNAVEYGLTGSVYTTSLATAHTAAARLEVGYVWVNNAGPHYLGAPFGGAKLSGIGREESIEELFTFTETKNINITL